MARHSLIKLAYVSAIVASILSIPITASAQTGIASVYSGGRTANGERANPHGTNEHTGRSIVVRINDRGPFIRGRVIDLMPAAARAIGCDGLAHVTLTVVGRTHGGSA
jgi:rare lipoprotein A